MIETVVQMLSLDIALASIQRSSLAQAKSQNQDRTPLPSRSASNVSEFVVDPPVKLEHLHMRTAVPIGTILRLQDTTNPVSDKQSSTFPLTFLS